MGNNQHLSDDVMTKIDDRFREFFLLNKDKYFEKLKDVKVDFKSLNELEQEWVKEHALKAIGDFLGEELDMFF